MPYSRIREAPESSSAATLRAVAAALNNAWHTPQHASASEKRQASLASILPDSWVQKAVIRAVHRRALDQNLVRFVKTEGLARQAVGHYDSIGSQTQYPAIFIGAPNGGVAYLAALLGVPFLPGYFLLSFADRTDADDIVSYHQHGSRLIDIILRINPDLRAINHYDPVHDRFLVRVVNHVRLKLLSLPEAYQAFISKHLAPGGYIFYIDNQYTWPQYQIDERHMFQVGGLGGYKPQHFLGGAKSLDNWLYQQGSAHQGGWKLADYPLIETHESEWGSLPAFRNAVSSFAEEHDFEFRSINGQHPEEFSAVAYTAYLWESRLHERLPNGLLVECFGQINPTAALRANLLPLWMPFNTQDSLEYLARMVPYIPKNLPTGLSLLANFTKTPDTPLAAAWQKIAEKIGPTQLIGVNLERYPRDVASVFNYLPDVQKWVHQYPDGKSRPQLTPEDLLEMLKYLQQHGSRLFSYLLESRTENTEASAPPAEVGV